MCVVSMVIDTYTPKFPEVWPPWPQALEDVEVQKTIDEFHQALAAAKVVDRLTGQPDCEDPEKAKLIARVRELEQDLRFERMHRALFRVVETYDRGANMTDAIEAAKAFL